MVSPCTVGSVSNFLCINKKEMMKKKTGGGQISERLLAEPSEILCSEGQERKIETARDKEGRGTSRTSWEERSGQGQGTRYRPFWLRAERRKTEETEKEGVI